MFAQNTMASMTWMMDHGVDLPQSAAVGHIVAYPGQVGHLVPFAVAALEVE